MKGMIFAAGLGTRLKPFTLSHPKAMVEVGGKPMLRNVIDRMVVAGVDDITINVHHFADEIIDYVAELEINGVNFNISDERIQLLDTGGGILKAGSFINGNEPVVICNADVWCDLDLRSLIEAHSVDGSDVTLAVSQRKSSRGLYFNSMDDKLEGWENLSTKELRPTGFIPTPGMNFRAFSGIQIINPAKILPVMESYAKQVGGVFSIIPFYLDNLAELKITGYDLVDNVKWFDVGKPETLQSARDFVDKIASTGHD